MPKGLVRTLRVVPGDLAKRRAQAQVKGSASAVLRDPAGSAANILRVVMLTTACAAGQVGCAGSSGNSATFAGGAANGALPRYNADGTVAAASATVPTPALVPTAASGGNANAASQAAEALTAVAKPGSAAYKIGPLDVLEISVFNVPDLTRTVQVAEEGTINYPLIGDLPVAGKTAHDLEHDMAQRLGTKYLRDPHVSVLVKEFNSQRVTISGSVKTSGVYVLKGKTSLMQVVAMAGDIDTATDSGDVVIFRKVDGQQTAARFDYDAIKAGTATDPAVEPGDVIVVNSSATKVALSNVLKVLPLATTAAVFSGL